MSLLDHFRRARSAGPQPPDEDAGPHLSEYVSFGAGHEECKVVFLHPARGIRRTVIDGGGRICGFPGLDRTDPHMPALQPAPRVQYRTEFTRMPDGRHRMLWQIQPDGRYWADEDGFGMTSDEEITLYTFLDESGRFTAPFRVYRIGRKLYCQNEEEDRHA